MTVDSQSQLTDLIALAQEPSSERRRELLRKVTDLFFVPGEARSHVEAELFDAVLSQLAEEMEEAVRVELAQRVAADGRGPQKLLQALVTDSIAVAEPILRDAPNLGLEVQVAVARTQGQDHLRALSSRADVAEQVTAAIVERADDETLDVLLRNDTARLSRESHEIAADRAAANPMLHEALVNRAHLPADLLNEMYFLVEGRLRETIMTRNAAMDPAELDAALSAGRRHIAAKDGALPADYAQVEAEVRALIARHALKPPALAAMLRAKETTRFLVALGELAHIDFHTARWILQKKQVDALAIVCKAADFDRPLFLTFAVLVLGADADAMGRARQYGELYDRLPVEAAQRTVRFWRMRLNAGDVRAA